MSASKPEHDVPVAAGAASDWNWNPDLPIAVSPVFAWPPKPGQLLRWMATSWLSLSAIVIELLLAIVIYGLTQPEWERLQDLSVGWVATIWLRNLFMLCLVAGALHAWLYRYSAQGRDFKFDARDFAVCKGSFNFSNQVHDNMFWSLCGGVTIWTGFEVTYFWLAANGGAPVIQFTAAPVWSVIWILLIPIWASFHFYWIHRALHWPPLYRLAHHLHHRNVNIGPWSGLSMHPVEHVLYFSSLLVHFIVPSDPLHVLFHCYNLALNPAVSHSGHEVLMVKARRQMALGDFFHQLHHRYFECNYGTAEVPWDAVFGSFHNGTPDATKRIRVRKQQMER